MSDIDLTASDGQFLFEMLQRRYGERWNPEQREGVQKGVKNIRQASDKLRSVNLKNSDESPALFILYRKDR